MEWLRVLRQGLVFLVFDEEAVSLKASISWCPGIFSIQIIDSRCDYWTRNKSDISLPLKKSDLDSARDSFWGPNNVKWHARWENLVPSWRSYAVEELGESRRSKSQDGGRDE